MYWRLKNIYLWHFKILSHFFKKSFLHLQRFEPLMMKVTCLQTIRNQWKYRADKFVQIIWNNWRWKWHVLSQQLNHLHSDTTSHPRPPESTIHFLCLNLYKWIIIHVKLVELHVTHIIIISSVRWILSWRLFPPVPNMKAFCILLTTILCNTPHSDHHSPHNNTVQHTTFWSPFSSQQYCATHHILITILLTTILCNTPYSDHHSSSCNE